MITKKNEKNEKNENYENYEKKENYEILRNITKKRKYFNKKSRYRDILC